MNDEIMKEYCSGGNLSMEEIMNNLKDMGY